jgi:outer membrane receptor protein involved in Fe transport
VRTTPWHGRLTWQPDREQVRLRANYSQVFRAPQHFGELNDPRTS